jgi:serine protease
MTLIKMPYFLISVAAASSLLFTISTSAADQIPINVKLGLKPITAGNPATDEMVAGFIVKPRSADGMKLAHALDMKDASGLAVRANMGMTVLRAMSGGAHVLRLDKPVTLSDARLVAARLMQDPSVELVEPDLIMHPTLTPTDTGYASQWHYFAPTGSNKGGANLPSAWDVTTGSSSIKVAVIDTGYRQHADLATVLQGYDFISDVAIANDGDIRDADAQDPGDWELTNECSAGSAASNSSWHGTHVAGTIAALMNNGVGGTGIAPGVKILPLRVLGKCGGFTSYIIDAMRWAVGIAVPGVPANANPVKIVNLSLGSAGACSVALQSAVTDVVNAGAVIVAATGNDGTTSVGSPANCNGVIAVTAHAIDGDNAHYADIGTQTAISAPGGGCGTLSYASGCTFGAANGPGVYSLFNSGTQGPVADSYGLYQGTSMATPHVSGVVVLMLSVNPALTPTQIKAYLQSSARAHPASTYCTFSYAAGLCGAGMLDANAALTLVANMPPAISLTNPRQLVAPSTTISLTSTVTPSSGRSIATYTWTQLSGTSVGTINNSNTANATFTSPATGVLTFQLSATDSAGKSSSALATVNVNSAPVLTAVPAKSVLFNNALTFNVGATDADGDPIQFHAVSIPAGATLSSSGAFSWTPAVAGSYTLTYYAYDYYANSTTGSVSITVTNPNAKSGGGGSLDMKLLLALALLTATIRISRLALLRKANRIRQ